MPADASKADDDWLDGCGAMTAAGRCRRRAEGGGAGGGDDSPRQRRVQRYHTRRDSPAAHPSAHNNSNYSSLGVSTYST